MSVLSNFVLSSILPVRKSLAERAVGPETDSKFL